MIVLTAEEMRAAEARTIAAGTPVETLMERAGLAAAEAIDRFAGPVPALVLCGPGNNGGDGYVIARALRGRGNPIAVAALGEPATGAARAACAGWGGPVGPLAGAAPAPMLIDALFGTGLKRPLDEANASQLHRLAAAARIRVAIDLPSGAATDDGALLSPIPDYDLTITFQALKPSHLLEPAARHMGRVVVADIGIEAQSALARIGRPRLHAPGPDDHKYRRGYVAVLAGEMPGAAALVASAAALSGAGYVRLFAADPLHGLPHAVVQSPGKSFEADARMGALAVGPGLGLGAGGEKMFAAARAAGVPLVVDADAIALLARTGTGIGDLEGAILTPHEGEFRRLFPDLAGSKVERARAAARAARAVIVYKGADTVVAAPDGRAAIGRASHWLASAGTGDVLAGIAAAMRASGMDAFDSAKAAVWLQGRAAELAGPALIADDLVAALPAAVAECL